MARRVEGQGRIAVSRGPSVRAQVYLLIRDAIVSLQLVPGQALSENELADQYGVSRTPVREALIRLADDGLVEVVPQLGTYVSRIDPQAVREAQFIRESLELASLPRAADRVTDADAAALRALLDEQRAAAAEHDLRRWFALDEDLHRTLLEIAGHRRVWSVVQSAKAHLDRVRMLSLPEPAVVEDLTSQHTAIVDNLLGGRRRAAETVLARHLRLVLDRLEAFEQRYPDYFVPEDTGGPVRRPKPARRAAARRDPR
jgi:GntR family transcriptional regulator, rspAB operon transcriptional repressor